MPTTTRQPPKSDYVPPNSEHKKHRASKLVRLNDFGLSTVISVSLFLPCFQQLKNNSFHLHWGIGSRKVFSEFLAREGNVIPHRFFLFHHNIQHCILVQYAVMTQPLHSLCLGKRRGCLLTFNSGKQQVLFVMRECSNLICRA